MCFKFKLLLYFIIFSINIKYLETFNANFHYNYNMQVEPFNTQIYKRELLQFFDRALFSFNGFQKIESIPVLFPIDICILNVEDSKYATTLHMNKNGAKHFKIFKMNNGTYELITDIPIPNGIAMDCISFNNKGYVAIALNLSEPIQYAKAGSPIFEIADNHIRSVQYFAAHNLTSVFLRASGNDLFLLHTYANSQETPNLHCPFFKWSGSTFNKMGRIPCSNAHQLTPFSIDYESYVAVANYADQNGRTFTSSEIYKYSRDKKKFVLFQKIQTNGAVDIKYFYIPQNEVKNQHFLVVGNSISKDSLTAGEGNNFDADSIFYLFDKGQFIPYQKISLYAVKKFLPVQNLEAEKFILLVACTDQDIKIYNFNDWKFEESKVQFTEGALGKGVSNMRIYQENEKSYLIIANNLMADNETNIFLPIFKQEQHANTLRQEIIDWANAEIHRLETINTKELKKRVEEKLKNLDRIKYLHNMQDISQANIQTVITESLIYPKLNMTTDYWMALYYVNQALESLETMLKQKPRLKRDAVSTTNHYDNLEYVYDTLNIKSLIVNKDLKANRINRVNSAKSDFENIKVKKAIVNDIKASPERVISWENVDYGDKNEVMTVKNLQINGKLNGYQLNDLFNKTLKNKEEIQFLKDSIAIENLKADTIMVNNNKVNGQDLGALVPVDGGKYVINQDIQFAAQLEVNQLHILERLNNIYVFNGQLDVLLKKSNKTQVIEGIKNVTNIKVLEPITIAGKMMGRQLEAISPNKFINEPLVLQGNFMINGDVHINHQLNTLDFIDLNEKLSAKQVLDMGIRMDKGVKDINLKFQQQLTANNSIINFVNQHDLQSLIKLNQDDIQIIDGFKVFDGSLEIRTGFSEVKILNGIDMEKLENNAFLKNNNQTIKVPMKIGNISTKSIESSTILLNTKNLTDYLTISGNQSIKGSLILENLTAQYLVVEHLNTDSKIFHQNVQDIYQQKSRNAPQEVILKQNRKLHGSIYVQNLILNSTINNKPIDIIENQILQLGGNIKYVGNFKFNYPMNVTNMTFRGKLNDIQAKDFGKYWLQKKAEKQVFTADQTFATINAEDGIILQGKLNGFTMEEFFTKAYRINQNEYIPCANFGNPLVITTNLTTKTLNDYIVPQDLFFKNSKKSPLILKSFTVKEKLMVEGSILNLISINNINLGDLQHFLNGTTKQTLNVEGAYFWQSPPLYKTLNNFNIRKTLDVIWLANENVELPHHVKIKDAYFEGLLEFEGHINNVNLDYLKENYLSKTKPQDISVEINFSKDVESEKEIHSYDLQVVHPINIINDGKRKISLDFNDFVRNTLKTSGPHIISGNWHLLEANVEGNLNDILINQLNLVKDVFHKFKITPEGYHLTAPKVFKSVYVKNLYADSSSSVNKIPVATWIDDAVYLYENYTVKGVTTMDSLNVYNNLIVHGKLNNITFNENNLLLKNKNQQLPGSIKILSYLEHEKRFLTNNIEHLYTDYVNGQSMPTFMENLITAAGNLEIKGHLTFKNALKVEKYDSPEGFLAQNNMAKRNIDKTWQRSGDVMEEFGVVKNYLSNIKNNIIYKLDHFNILQTITSRPAELVTLSIKTDNLVVDIMAISNMQDKSVTIFKWVPKEKLFRKTKEFDWLPYDPLLLEIIHKKFVFHQKPLEVKELKTFIRQDLKVFYNVLSNVNNAKNYFEFSNQNCILFVNNLEASMDLYNFCLNTQNPEKVIAFNHIVQQISFGHEYVVLLTNSSVLIYDIRLNSTNNKYFQKLAINKPKQMALGSFKDFKFLAVISRGKSSHTLNHGFVEIYRSVNSSTFTFFQSLNCLKPSDIKFSFIENSNDFLIHIISDSLNKPYLIYQYQGVSGFKEILSDSMLPAKFVSFRILNLNSSKHYLVALNGQENITLVELALIKI